MRKTLRWRVFTLSCGLIIAALLLLTTLSLAFARTSDVKTQLCVVIDGSGTITEADWAIIVNALSNAVNDSVPHDGSVELAIVQFGYNGGLRARTELSPTVIDGTTYLEVANHILGIQKLGGSTSMADGLYLGWEELRNSTNYQSASKHVINLATDGIPNIRNENATSDLNGDGQVNAYDDIISVVNGSINQGLTELDMELIGLSDANIWFRDNVVYPQPGVFAPPFNKTGWVRQVAGIEEFANTIGQSFQAIVGTTEVGGPSANEALAAVVITAATTAIAANAGEAFSSAISKLPLPRQLLELFGALGEEVFKTVREKEIKAKKKAPFINKAELIALTTSVLIMIFVYSFAEAGGLERFLNLEVLAEVVPIVCLTVLIARITAMFSDAIAAKTCDLQKKFCLWPSGIVAILISGLLFLFPFAIPWITRYKGLNLSPKSKALMMLLKTLILLILALPFAILIMVGAEKIGNSGLLIVLAWTSAALIPLKPMAGKFIFDYKKSLSALAFALIVILLFGFTVDFFEPIVYLTVGAISALLTAITLVFLKRSLKNESHNSNENDRSQNQHGHKNATHK
jgi:hypothetical protein